jgi:5-methylcytosine-specific restriction endonuclease McrA
MPSRPPIYRHPGWTPPVRKRTDAIDREYGLQRWRKLAALVIRRDGGICCFCGALGADTAHHLVEKRDGGSDDPANLKAAHRGCHNRQHGARGRGG